MQERLRRAAEEQLEEGEEAGAEGHRRQVPLVHPKRTLCTGREGLPTKKREQTVHKRDSSLTLAFHFRPVVWYSMIYFFNSSRSPR